MGCVVNWMFPHMLPRCLPSRSCQIPICITHKIIVNPSHATDHFCHPVNKIYQRFCGKIALGVEEVVRDLLQAAEEEIGCLRGPRDDAQVRHRVEEQRQDDGEAQASERLK